jgi:hypothetical protein
VALSNDFANASDTIPLSSLIWAPPREAAVCTGEDPNKFAALEDWSKQVVERVTKNMQRNFEWNYGFKNVSYVLFVSPKGDIQDPIVLSGKDPCNERLALSGIARSGPMPPPPDFIDKHRIRLDFDYPKVRMFIEDNFAEGLVLRETYFFNSIRVKRPE